METASVRGICHRRAVGQKVARLPRQHPRVMPDVVDDIDVWFFASRWRRHAEPLVYKINKLTSFDRASCEAIRGDMATPFLHKALQGPNVVKTPRDVVSSDVFESRHIVE